MNISVIIPTYNRKHTLARAIDSVLIQTYKPYEIIVIDDGSDDGTSDWINNKFPSIRLIQQPNLGVSSARNKGVYESRGDWIALLDSDDEWRPNKLERQIRYLKNNSKILFCHTNEIWIRNGIRINQGKKHQKYGGMIFEKCLDMCRISPSSSLFHKKILNDVGYFDESLNVCEDYDLWLRVTSKYPVLFIDELLIIKYGGHKDQLSIIPDGIERYRIKSLEKLLFLKSINNDQKNQIRKVLKNKFQIYGNGLKKRGKHTAYKKLLKKFNQL